MTEPTNTPETSELAEDLSAEHAEVAQPVDDAGQATVADQAADPDQAADAETTGVGKLASALEEEGEIAADYLEELLDIFDLDGDIDIDVRGGRAYLEVTAGSNSNLRVISEPETVEALQELTRLAVQAKTNSFSRLILDVGGSRQARVDELTKVAQRAIDKVTASGETFALKPMSSYERKIIHDLISDSGLVSESEGEGRDRHIVVKPQA
jgi:spoIIIJ-associated protein